MKLTLNYSASSWKSTIGNYLLCGRIIGKLFRLSQKSTYSMVVRFKNPRQKGFTAVTVFKRYAFSHYWNWSIAGYGDKYKYSSESYFEGSAVDNLLSKNAKSRLTYTVWIKFNKA